MIDNPNSLAGKNYLSLISAAKYFFQTLLTCNLGAAWSPTSTETRNERVSSFQRKVLTVDSIDKSKRRAQLFSR